MVSMLIFCVLLLQKLMCVYVTCAPTHGLTQLPSPSIKMLTKHLSCTRCVCVCVCVCEVMCEVNACLCHPSSLIWCTSFTYTSLPSFLFPLFCSFSSLAHSTPSLAPPPPSLPSSSSLPHLSLLSHRRSPPSPPRLA